MEDKLISYEVNAITKSVSIKKRKYVTEADEFGNEITKAVNWRCVVAHGDEAELSNHLSVEIVDMIKSSWVDEIIATT